jgi:hypothetical protein
MVGEASQWGVPADLRAAALAGTERELVDSRQLGYARVSTSLAWSTNEPGPMVFDRIVACWRRGGADPGGCRRAGDLLAPNHRLDFKQT